MPGSAFRPPSPATPTSAGCADRLCGRERVDAGHPLRHLRPGSRYRPVAPAAPGQEQEQHPEHDLRPGDPAGGGAAGRDVARVRDEVGGAADHRQRDHPAGQKHRPVHLRPAREQHQDHRDDRHGTDRHTNRECQYLANSLCHTSSLPEAGRRDGSRRPHVSLRLAWRPLARLPVSQRARAGLSLPPGGWVNAPGSQLADPLAGGCSDAGVFVFAGGQPGFGPAFEPAVEDGHIRVSHGFEGQGGERGARP